MERRVHHGLHAIVLYAHFDTSTPARAAFRSHLAKVAQVFRELEREQDGDQGTHVEQAIQQCLPWLLQAPEGAAAPDNGSAQAL
jgi:hypothetical protein